MRLAYDKRFHVASHPAWLGAGRYGQDEALPRSYDDFKHLTLYAPSMSAGTKDVPSYLIIRRPFQVKQAEYRPRREPDAPATRHKIQAHSDVTTEALAGKKEQGKAAGATGWIVKPFDPEKLLHTVAKVLP